MWRRWCRSLVPAATAPTPATDVFGDELKVSRVGHGEPGDADQLCQAAFGTDHNVFDHVRWRRDLALAVMPRKFHELDKLKGCLGIAPEHLLKP